MSIADRTTEGWLTYARRLAFKYGRGLHCDEQASAAGWALAVALRSYKSGVPFAAYLARGVRQIVSSDRLIAQSCGLVAYGQTKAPPRPKRVPLRPILIHDHGPARADTRELLELLEPKTADTLWRVLCGQSKGSIARARRCNLRVVNREISQGISLLQARVA